jgi:hypothetical protein
MKGKFTQFTRWIQTWSQGRTGRFLLTQLTHTGVTVIVLAALLAGAARAGALGQMLAPAAQVPGSSFTTVNYQGRLADTGGSPIDNTNPGIGMTFALYDVESGGSPVWVETHAKVPVSEGLFSVRLGSVNALDTSHLTGDRWLGIQVGTDPEMAPREKLAAVPYAMQAGMALTVTDDSITTEKIADGAVNNRHLALTRYALTMSVPDHFDLTGSEQVLGETTINVPYPATYLVFLSYTASGHGGRSILYMRDENGSIVCGSNHTSDMTSTASNTCLKELPAGAHTFRLSARIASSDVGQEVRSETGAIIIPLTQAP